MNQMPTLACAAMPTAPRRRFCGTRGPAERAVHAWPRGTATPPGAGTGGATPASACSEASPRTVVTSSGVEARLDGSRTTREEETRSTEVEVTFRSSDTRRSYRPSSSASSTPAPRTLRSSATSWPEAFRTKTVPSSAAGIASTASALRRSVMTTSPLPTSPMSYVACCAPPCVDSVLASVSR